MSKKNGAHCHILIAKTAQEMTRELYAAVMQDDKLYSQWKKMHPDANSKKLEEEFVKKYWGKAVEGARGLLAHMLNNPMDEVLKNEISEALILDNTLIKGRKNPTYIMG